MNEKNITMPRTTYEDHLASLSRREPSFVVAQEPRINRKTHDIHLSDGVEERIIECTELKYGSTCDKEDHVYGDENPSHLHRRLYDALENKIAKYPPSIIGDAPLVIAIQNNDCSNFGFSILDVTIGADRFIDGYWVRIWEGDYRYGLFGNPKYRHCSAILHSVGHDHVLISNRCAINAVDPAMFPFASLIDLHRHTNCSLCGKQPSNPCPDAHFIPVRECGRTIKDPNNPLGLGIKEIRIVPTPLEVSEATEKDGNIHVELSMKMRDPNDAFNS